MKEQKFYIEIPTNPNFKPETRPTICINDINKFANARVNALEQETGEKHFHSFEFISDKAVIEQYESVENNGSFMNPNCTIFIYRTK